MKAKTKFDPKVVQQFVIEHTEKFVMGLVAVLFLFFAYRSYVVVGNGYQRKPEELKAATKAAFDKIALGPATKKPPAPTTKPVPDGPDFPLYAKIIDDHKLSIDAAKYPMPLGPDGSIFAPLRPREAPEVFAVENVRAIPGRGAVPNTINDRNAGNGGPTAGKRWIVVTGLVPFKKQYEEYRKKFENHASYDPVKDIPRYRGYLIQKAEVVPGDTGEPKWKSMMFPSLNKNELAAKIGVQATEIADLRFTSPRLTSPLPRLVDSTWGNEAVSPPQIPLMERELANADAPSMMRPQPSGPSRGPNTYRPGRSDVPPRRGTGGRDLPSRQGGGGMIGPSAAPDAGAGWDDIGDNVPKRDTETSTEDKESQVPEYLLLRFFDVDVKPNKQYQYRIFPLLDNPNQNLKADELQDQKLALFPILGVLTPRPLSTEKGDFVDWPTEPTAKWSAPCTSGRVSDDMRLLGGTVSAAGGGRPEAVAEVRVLLWQEQSGRNGNFHKDGLFRGTVLEFPQVELKTPGNPRTTKRDLNAKSVLVDMLGGEWLDRDHKLANPGMILVMDEFGNLVLHDEAAEAKEWDEATKEPEDRPGPAPIRPVRGNVREGGPSRENPQDDIDTSGVRRKPVR